MQTLKCVNPTATLTDRKEYKGNLLRSLPTGKRWYPPYYNYTKTGSLRLATHFQCKDDRGTTRIYKLDRFKNYNS